MTRGARVHCLRDLTRGGLAAALCEIATTAKRDIEIEESAVPVGEAVRGACELLGLDPMHVANEGRLIAFVDPDGAEDALECMRTHRVAESSALVGHVSASGGGQVRVRGPLGARRVLSMPSGEQLPRIC